MSLLSVAHQMTELMKFRFKVSKTQYKNSKKNTKKSFIKLFKGANKSKKTLNENKKYTIL